MNIDNLDSTPIGGSVGLDRSQETVSEIKPQRIGGFLIVIAVGLFINLIQNLTYFLQSIAPIIRTSLWMRFTDPESTEYHPYWQAVLIFEAVASLLFLLTNIVMLWLFYRKKRIFPKLVIVAILLQFAITLLSYFLSGFIPAVAESEYFAKERYYLIVKFISLHIWIPYFLL